MKIECNLSFKGATLNSSERNSQDKLQRRFNWIEQWTLTESGFYINMRPSLVWSTVDTPAFVETRSTRESYHTILGVISAMRVIDVGLRVP